MDGFTAASLAITAISWVFIMPVPALFSAALTVCLGVALAAARRVSGRAAALTRGRGGLPSATASA